MGAGIEPVGEPSLLGVERGVFRVDGVPRVLLATDYHYFRDDAANWRDRLRAQRDAGFDVLTVYVPWRHHAPVDPVREGGAYDFTGETQANRDVVGLVDVAAEEGLLVLLKPGPFVHAELPYGGLPEYVRPDRNPRIEPELDAFGRVVRWELGRMRPESAHPLPAPFGAAYNVYVRDWLRAVAREVAAPGWSPRGPVVGLQIMNEGIYSDSAWSEPHRMGFSPSSLERFRSFLRDRYGSLERYNRCHETRVSGWDEVDPPREPVPLSSRKALLAYLDWSAFEASLYVDLARLYMGYLVQGGVPRDAPVVFNFNPTGGTYRTRPASNDGWYTRANVEGARGFTFGSTNWIGVVAGDPVAFRQFTMATTAFRGPVMELNWGFRTLYDPTYEYVTPSHFETMAALACGATGVTVYTLAGVRAFRSDPNLDGEWIPARMSDRDGGTAADYPGDAPILSSGERTPKYWTLRQIAQYFAAEGPRFVDSGPVTPVAWAIYPPYAWAGQWLPRGDPDDLLWRPPLKAVPRGAYHGLDAFVEMMIGVGGSFRQVDVTRGDVRPDVRFLCMSAHEYMDAATQERLASFVERGGSLLLTNLVPELDERLEPLRGALAERVFPHRVVGHKSVPGTEPVLLNGEPVGFAQEFVRAVEPPSDADGLMKLGDGSVVGYRRRVGHGAAVYVGFGPWRARHSADDSFIARSNQRLTWRLIESMGAENEFDPRCATSPEEVVVWQHGDPVVDHQQIFAVVREARGDVEVDFRRPGGARERLRLASPSQAVHAVAVEAGHLRACYLKGTNDLRAEAVAPRVSLGRETWSADDPCDLCVAPARDGNALSISVAHLEGDATRVRLSVPLRDVLDVTSDDGDRVDPEAVGDGVVLDVRDLRVAGAYRVDLAARGETVAEAASARRT